MLTHVEINLSQDLLIFALFNHGRRGYERISPNLVWLYKPPWSRRFEVH